MSAADQARAKAERLSAARPRPTGPVAASTPAPSTPTPPAQSGPSRGARARPVRLTLDLAPEMFNTFEDAVTAVSRRGGGPKVTKSDVLRELVRLFVADPTTQTDVLTAIRAQH